MGDPESIFLQFKLPDATTWFYFSLLLAVALFFKFSRLLSMRNLDVLSLFLPVPGLLLLMESRGESRWGYAWLMGASGWLLVRCLWDLALVRRPALSPNLSAGGLAWLGGALFASLVVIAARDPEKAPAPDAKGPPVPDRVQREVDHLLGQPEAARALAVLCHLAVVAGLFWVGWRHFGDAHAGVAAATFYLLLPYPYLLLPRAHVLPGQWYHAWPMALVVWALAAYRRPVVVGVLLGVAAGSVFFPALVLPVWLSFYWRRGSGRFAAGFVLGVGLCLGWLAVLALLSGEGLRGISTLLPMPARDWLPWAPPPSDLSLWSGAHWAYRIPVFVAYLSLMLMTVVWPGRKDLGHVIALSAALLIGTQFWYADQGGVYVLWYLPLLLLLAFRPNLSASQAPPIAAGGDGLTRTRRWLLRRLARVFGLQEPTVKVS